MPKATTIKPTHKALKKYYAALQSYRDHQVTHEGALETAFQRLLEETAKSHGWKLIPKQKLKVGKQTIYPDGTLRDIFNMRCGFWEAKDTDDKLDAEIQKKIDKGYAEGIPCVAAMAHYDKQSIHSFARMEGVKGQQQTS